MSSNLPLFSDLNFNNPFFTRNSLRSQIKLTDTTEVSNAHDIIDDAVKELIDAQCLEV